MIKIRLQGTRNDIKAFIKILERCAKVNVIRISDFKRINENEKYYKVFIDLKRNVRKYDEKELRNGKSGADGNS